MTKKKDSGNIGDKKDSMPAENEVKRGIVGKDGEWIPTADPKNEA